MKAIGAIPEPTTEEPTEEPTTTTTTTEPPTEPITEPPTEPTEVPTDEWKSHRRGDNNGGWGDNQWGGVMNGTVNSGIITMLRDSTQ